MTPAQKELLSMAEISERLRTKTTRTTTFEQEVQSKLNHCLLNQETIMRYLAGDLDEA